MPRGKPNARERRLTPTENAIDFLTRARVVARSYGKDPLAWKWLALHVHSAAYAFAIQALRGTDAESRVTRRAQDGARSPISFKEAMRRIAADQWMIQNTRSYPWPSTAAARSSLSILDQYRSNLLGLVLDIWMIEEHDLLMACLDVVEVIRFLALESGNVLLKPADRTEVETLVRTTRRALMETQLYRDHVAALAKRQRLNRRIHESFKVKPEKTGSR